MQTFRAHYVALMATALYSLCAYSQAQSPDGLPQSSSAIVEATKASTACRNGSGRRRGNPTAMADGVAANNLRLRDVVVVGNNWDGTIDLYDPHTYRCIKVLDAVPDKEERLKELDSGFIRRIMSWFIKHLIGEGHHQMVDDMFTSHDGRQLFVSRPSFADVVALDVNTGEIVWRTPVEGSRSDHAAISPDGRIFLVSASTARKVHAIDTANSLHCPLYHGTDLSDLFLSNSSLSILVQEMCSDRWRTEERRTGPFTRSSAYQVTF